MISSMASIKADFKVNNLIASLEKYLEAHKTDYAKAIVVWRKDVLGKLENLFQEYTDKKQFNEIDIARNLGLNAPVNCESGYTQLINVFKNIQTDTINIEIEEANKILNDDWSWATSAKISNSIYSSRA